MDRIEKEKIIRKKSKRRLKPKIINLIADRKKLIMNLKKKIY